MWIPLRYILLPPLVSISITRLRLLNAPGSQIKIMTQKKYCTDIMNYIYMIYVHINSNLGNINGNRLKECWIRQEKVMLGLFEFFKIQCALSGW